MQVLPLLTPTNYISNNKKRSRPDDDFESNYFKKRLISTPPPTTPPHDNITTSTYFNNSKEDTPIIDYSRGNITPPESKHHVRIDDMDDYLLQNDHNNTNQQEYKAILNRNDQDSRIHVLDINGTMLPLEHRTGETKYCIPSFVLNKKIPIPTSNTTTAQSGQLILYQPNNVLPPSPPTSPIATINEEEEEDDNVEEEYEPMDID